MEQETNTEREEQEVTEQQPAEEEKKEAESPGTVSDEKFLCFEKKNWSVLCLVLGIVSIVFAWFGYGAIVGIAAGILGIILSKRAKDAGLSNGQLTAGMVLSVIGVIGGILIFVSCVACSGFAACLSCSLS